MLFSLDGRTQGLRLGKADVFDGAPAKSIIDNVIAVVVRSVTKCLRSGCWRQAGEWVSEGIVVARSRLAFGGAATMVDCSSSAAQVPRTQGIRLVRPQEYHQPINLALFG